MFNKTKASIDQEPITQSEPTPIPGLCHGIFTDQFIFRHILGHFFPQKLNLHHVDERIRSIRYQKTKRYLKAKKIIFRSVGLLIGLWNFKDIQNSRKNRSKNKLVREKAVTRAHGSCSLRVIGSYID